MTPNQLPEDPNKLKLDEDETDDQKPQHLVMLIQAQCLKQHKTMLEQAQRKTDIRNITDYPTKAAGQGTPNPKGTANRGTTDKKGTDTKNTANMTPHNLEKPPRRPS